jgi:non-homologous end joining protein Ku
MSDAPNVATPTVSRASTRTVLRLGEVEAAIGLFKITTDPKARKWDTPPVEVTDHAGSGGEAKGSPLAPGGKQSSRSKAPAGGTEPPPPKPKGITKPDGAFVDLTEQIKSIAEATTLDRLEVVSFVDSRHVPRERIVGAYYVGAGQGGGFPPSQIIGLLYRALKLRSRAAVVRWGKRSRSSVGVMIPHRSGALLVLEMAYAEHILGPNPDCLAHQHLEFSDEQVEHAAELIDAMAGRRESLDDIRDHRAELEEQLVTRAEHGEEDDFAPAHTVVDDEASELGDLLEASIRQAGAKA